MADRSNVLNNIVLHKEKEVEQRKQLVPLADLQATVSPSRRSLKAALEQPGNRFILEYKRASPSKGDIRKNLTVDECYNAYMASADAYSVLTDKQFFNGNHILLKAMAEKTDKPVLCKDFFIDVYQVYEARAYGADAILLMLSVLNDERYRQLAEVAKTLELDVLTEVHTEEECQRAIQLNANIIGINNRNLKTLHTDLETTLQLAPMIPEHITVISESGINERSDVNRLASKVDGFLVGSSLMASPNITAAAKKLVYSPVKICGVTSVEVAEQCFNLGASYVGLMFYPESVRAVDATTAEFITHQVPGNYVGVFVDESVNTIYDRVERCGLTAVQCHGNESSDYVSQLKSRLPRSVEVWKALSLRSESCIRTVKAWLEVADKVVIDYQTDESKGGNGKRFDWSLLSELFQLVGQSRIVIAGGINADNVSELFEFTDATIDLSSGVETERGVKDVKLISKFFATCRNNGKKV